MKKQDFKVLKTKDLYPFPDNPFHVAEDETLSELAESIKEFGIVTPIITRPKEDGDGYRLLSLPWRLSKEQVSWLKKKTYDKNPDIRALAEEQYEMRFAPTQFDEDEADEDFIEDEPFE